MYGENLRFTATVESERGYPPSGTVRVIIRNNTDGFVYQDDTWYCTDDTHSKEYNIPASEFPAGEYTIYVTYMGNNFYESCSNSFNVDISSGAHFEGISEVYTNYYGEDIIISGLIRDGLGAQGGTVYIKDTESDETLYWITTEVDGTFSQTIEQDTLDLMYGREYNLVYNTEYGETIRQSFRVQLVRHNVTMTVPSTIKGTIGDTVEIPVILSDENGNPVSSGEVTYTITKYEEE